MNLTGLHLVYNGLANLTLPEGLTSLTTLDLSENHLTVIQFAEPLPVLKRLLMSGPGNRILDFSFLNRGNLSSEQKELWEILVCASLLV